MVEVGENIDGFRTKRVDRLLEKESIDYCSWMKHETIMAVDGEKRSQ